MRWSALAPGGLAIDRVQERHELGVGVTGLAPLDDVAFKDIQGRKSVVVPCRS